MKIERKQIINNSIAELDKNKKKAKEFFSYAYNYDNLDKDFKDWYDLWKSLTHEEKFTIVSKAAPQEFLHNEGKKFNAIMAALLTTKNPVKAVKLARKHLEDEDKKK